MATDTMAPAITTGEGATEETFQQKTGLNIVDPCADAARSHGMAANNSARPWMTSATLRLGRTPREVR